MLQQGVEQQVLVLIGEQTIPKLGQDREVEARIGEFQAEQVLQVDAGSDGIGSLAVGKILQKLHNQDEGETGGGVGRLTALRKHVGKEWIRVDGTQLVIQAHVDIAFGESG